MKRRFKNSCKGFTLIEVIVAMVILGIASLLLVGMYASVCARIRSNNDFNDRMSEQQKYVRRERQVLLRVSLMFIMTAAFRQVPQSTAVQHREITHLPSSAQRITQTLRL